MYECRHCFADDCERLPTTLHSANELLINAHEVYPHILSIKFYSFENVGHPLDPKTFIDEKTVSIVRPGQERLAAGPDTDLWMEGLSAAELLRQFGIDPDVRVTPDGNLLTPEGETFTIQNSDSESGSSSENESPESSGVECTTIVADRSKVLRKNIRAKIQERAEVRGP